MSRAHIGMLRALVAAFAALGVIGCNALLGIEEPPQAPPADAHADGDGGLRDVSAGDTATDDVTATDGFTDAVAPETSLEAGPVDDVSTDGPDDVGDPPDGGDPSDAPVADTGRPEGNTDVRTDAGRVDGDAGRVDAVRSDATRPDGSSPPEIDLVLTITNDQDDATWINTTDERLHYDMASLYLEVGADTEAGKVGLRFELPVPPGSIIQSAIIELHRTIGDALANESMKVQVYESANVPPFADAHTHGPEGHAAGGLWPTTVGPIAVGENGKAVQTSELKTLVQHIIDRPDWVAGAAIGFAFSAQVMGVRWVDFADSSLGLGQPSLHVVYMPP